jgi:hypothetical protein
MQPRFPKDLYISNVLRVRSFGRVPSKTETWGLRSRTSVAVEDVVADLKVAKDLAQRLWHRTSSTSTYSHTYGDHDDSRNPVSSWGAEVEALEQGFENSATRRRVAVVILVSYAALREATRERERVRSRAADQRRPVHLGGVRRRSWREARENSVLRALQGGLCIVGRGDPYPSSRHQGRWTKGGGSRRPGLGNPNPGRPGPGFGAPPFFSLISLMGLFC